MLGFLGLGAMGGAMARNLLAAGYRLSVFDIDSDRLSAAAAAGAEVLPDARAVVGAAGTVLTSLPYAHTWNEVAAQVLVPEARAGQVFVDLGTNTPIETRRFAGLLAAKGASLLDAPVSGGTAGAAAGSLWMFAGGDRDVFDGCLPILRVLGDPDHIVYCGLSGSGHVVKGVNQMAMGLLNAAALEAVAFGVKAGVEAAVLDSAVGGDQGFRGLFRKAARAVAAGKGRDVGIKIGQLGYYLDEAAEKGFTLPISRALVDYLKDAEKIVMEANRPSPSFWHELAER